MYIAVLILKGHFGCVYGKSAALWDNWLISLMSYRQEVMGTDDLVSDDDAHVLLASLHPRVMMRVCPGLLVVTNHMWLLII